MSNAGGGGDVIQEAMSRRGMGISPFSQQAPSAPSAAPSPMSPTGSAPAMPSGSSTQMNQAAQSIQSLGGGGALPSPASFEAKTILGALKSRLEALTGFQEKGLM